MALIKCEECGQMVSDKAVACPHCGAPVEIKKEEKSIICEECGQEMPESSTECPNCGCPVEDSQPADDLSQSPVKDSQPSEVPSQSSSEGSQPTVSPVEVKNKEEEERKNAANKRKAYIICGAAVFIWIIICILINVFDNSSSSSSGSYSSSSYSSTSSSSSSSPSTSSTTTTTTTTTTSTIYGTFRIKTPIDSQGIKQILKLNSDGSAEYTSYVNGSVFMHTYGVWENRKSVGYVHVTLNDWVNIVLGSNQEYARYLYIVDGKIAKDNDYIKSHDSSKYSELVRE